MRNLSSLLCLLLGLSLTARLVVAAAEGPTRERKISSARESSIKREGNQWTLANGSLRAILAVHDGSIDMTSLRLADSGAEFLTGGGQRYLFRHVIGGKELRADDGLWQLQSATTHPIMVRGQDWGRELRLGLKRKGFPLSIVLVFEIYNGKAGLRYYSFIKNEHSRKMTIEASDVLALNLPDKPHVLWHVPWQTSWSSTTGSIDWGKRQCIVRYNDTGTGWALLPENNWCTSLKAKATLPGSGDPKHPFLFYSAWGDGARNVKVSTDPVAVKLVLFPGEQFEYFSVNLQLFAGDQWDARYAVAQHFRKRFKYTRPQPSVDFQEYRVEWLQTDANARSLLIPALAEAGFDRWEVTWRWNGSDAGDNVEPAAAFTNDLPALADFCLSRGIKIGFYNTMTGGWWGQGRDLADPQALAWKRKQIEDVTIGKYHSTWQMIDLGELWKNDQVTAYSHPTDNVYRKYVNLRDYMTDMTRRHHDWTPLTTCETECPPGFERKDQCVSLMVLGENGQAGSYCRTDNRCGSGQSPRSNLADAFNYYGLLPIEAFVGVYGEDGVDPWPGMFSTACYYGTLFSGCSTFYSDVRKWTPEQKSHMRRFNDWRRNPRFEAMLGHVPRPLTGPLADGAQPTISSPFAWMYLDDSASQGLIIAVGHGLRRTCHVRLRGLDPKRFYWIEDITLGKDDFEYACLARRTGRELMRDGLNLDLTSHGVGAVACWIKAEKSLDPQVIYADANVIELKESNADGRRAIRASGPAGGSASLVIAKPRVNGVEKVDVRFDASGRAVIAVDPEALSEELPAAPQTTCPVLPSTASFLGAGSITDGKWAENYGKTAAWLAGADGWHAEQKGFALSTSDPVWVWTNEGDKRVMEPAEGSASRRAACWYASGCLCLTVDAPNSKPYKLTIYILDYDRHGRQQSVRVVGMDGCPLHYQLVDKTSTLEGTALSWNVTGSVLLEVEQIVGANAVVSAVFVDAD